MHEYAARQRYLPPLAEFSRRLLRRDDEPRSHGANSAEEVRALFDRIIAHQNGRSP